MATNKKNTNSKKKQNSNSKKVDTNTNVSEKRFDEAEISRIVGIVVFAFSIILFFIAVIPGMGIWEILHKFYVGVNGWIVAILLPLVCFFYSGLYTIKKSNNKMTIEIILIVILMIILCSFVDVCVHNTIDYNNEKYLDAIKNAYINATSTLNGGFIGAVFGRLLITMGKAPAIILQLVFIMVDLMILFGTTVRQFFAGTTKPVKKAVEIANPYIEQHKEKRRNTDIDIFLDGEEQKNKTRKNKAIDDDQDLDDTSKLIKEINQATAKNIADRDANPKTNNKTPKASLDEIVKNASEKQQEKQLPKLESFDVPDENLSSTINEYKLPPLSLLSDAKRNNIKNSSEELKNNGTLLIDTLRSFGVDAEIIDISRGPSVTRYELKPAAGVRINKITNLSDDIALSLAAESIRIEAPIPGKSAVGIELPNTLKDSVAIKEILGSVEFNKEKSLLSTGLGKDISGSCVLCDIEKMPHLLIAGTTGSGKSVCMNTLILSILYRSKPDEVKLLMIDPKKVEFSKYEGIPHLLVPVVTEPRKAAGALGWAVSEMLKRYQKFSDTGVRDIYGYNKYVKKHPEMEFMPKIVICIDELADLMMAASKEVEDSICRLAQMARAAGMHLVIATQRPSVDVITGLIKANISSRIALTTTSAIDSRTILDTGGAEKLLGRGDMLYSPIGSNKPLRVQGCWVSDEEVESVCEYIKKQGNSNYSSDIQKEIEEKSQLEKNGNSNDADSDEALDPLFDKAVETVLENGRASTSFLQRKLGVGYSRGSKIMDQLEDKGIIGPQDGAKPREIRINMQQWIQMKAYDTSDDSSNEELEQVTFDDSIEE